MALFPLWKCVRHVVHCHVCFQSFCTYLSKLVDGFVRITCGQSVRVDALWVLLCWTVCSCIVWNVAPSLSIPIWMIVTHIFGVGAYGDCSFTYCVRVMCIVRKPYTYDWLAAILPPLLLMYAISCWDWIWRIHSLLLHLRQCMCFDLCPHVVCVAIKPMACWYVLASLGWCVVPNLS